MFCPKCGSNVPDSTKFCPTCGETLAGEPAQQAPVAEPQPQYQQPQQPQQPVYQPAPANGAPVMKVSEFFWTSFLLGLPVVGFILALVWGFSSDVNPNKRNFCRAMLIWVLVGVVLTIILTIAGVGIIGSIVNSLEGM